MTRRSTRSTESPAMRTTAEEKRARRAKRPADSPVGADAGTAAAASARWTRSQNKRAREAAADPPLDEHSAALEAAKVAPLFDCSTEAGSSGCDEQGSGLAAEQEEVEKECSKPSPKKRVGCSKKLKKDGGGETCFVGDSVPEEEAKQRWPERYQRKGNCASGSVKRVDDEPLLRARCHYLQAKVEGVTYNLYDDAYVKAGDGEPDYIGRIVEFFETTGNELYFTAQWFFRAEDTVIKDHAHCHGAKVVHDSKRVFLSEEKNDNLLDCIVSKINIQRVTPNIDLKAKEKCIPSCDLYYDMSYSLAYSTFANISTENSKAGSESSSTISSEDVSNHACGKAGSDSDTQSGQKKVIRLLDLYSGCGAMSTGLCLGANLSGINLQTCWAVDLNQYACQSLKLNHPKTEVRNEKAEDFLALLIEWEKLCKKYRVIGNQSLLEESDSDDVDDEVLDNLDLEKGEFEVGKLVGICYGDPSDIGKVGLKFKVRWKGYDPSYDTWEPIDGLSNCQEKVKEFVRHGYKKNILPLPGQADMICGGPPCQGISGFNRFRNKNAPLEDPKNQQMVVYMDIVEFLKPKYVLMENVVDILKFAQGFLGRYALSRLVSLNYQARLGMMAAGCYGLPQFRMRVFLWGARPNEILPQFPLPTHDVVVRGGAPNEFEQNIVAYDEYQRPQLEKALHLEDAISDLPLITNYEDRDEMPYGKPAKTDFQHFIRMTRSELVNFSSNGWKAMEKHQLFDHKPLQLNEDDYQRVCRIPKKKGANFRDLPGVIVGHDNIVEWDPNIERVLLPSGKPLVPDYAMSFIKGRSPKPFGRLWWDETVPTVVTRAEPHNQIIIHPEQDRVLSIRENARLQGFPDFYKLQGPVKERYIQVGNAVAVPVARALGYALGLAFQGHSGHEPLMHLPKKFPLHDPLLSSTAVDIAESVR
ncbi:DNA (cytosine-5)-methyltransferase 1-like [Canna indica]|uniref:Cytosine-specific methyltransferase n=1 Tax=Canna indica TaxID=4628 RepID=A0AAQ3JWN7_9LILI|nr:DNA (cytosine-5)-methyltransferase 1-like [Canna indica]